VGWGPSLHTSHRWVLPEAYALDIARLGESGSTYRREGTRFTDYYAYGTEVYAAAAGKVLESANDVPEDDSLLQRPNESIDAYTARVRENQARLLKIEHGITGNYVLIDHGNREYSLYAHLQPGSVRVRAGDPVAAGAFLGRLGSSGNSTEPHLHFQGVQWAPGPRLQWRARAVHQYKGALGRDRARFAERRHCDHEVILDGRRPLPWRV
jgi:murein DD-endopeptidase MepM/ murein hydrolase activator NlpD